MANVLNEDFLPEKYFEEISQIPRGSYNEKAISDHIVEFAEDLGLHCRRDEYNNVMVFKAASPGCENHEPVLLQSHMDMVCEKAPGSDHDFKKDPVELIVEDGWLRAKDTTLGADDGAGVAYMMAVLADDSLAHPPLECLFTVEEEVGCTGASKIKGSSIRSRRMISLDNEGGNVSYVCSAGMGVMTHSREFVTVPVYKIVYMLRVSGLIGGHSGEEIQKERANAIKLCARVLYNLKKIDGQMQLVSINGGSFANSIPRSCTALIATAADESVILEKIRELEAVFRSEYADSDPDITLAFEEADPYNEGDIATAVKAFGVSDTADIIGYLNLIPYGMSRRSLIFDDMAAASDNLGIVKTVDGKISVTTGSRGAEDSIYKEICDGLSILSEKYGWTCESFTEAACWPYIKESEMRDMAAEAYRHVTGDELIMVGVHGGLECGFISAACPGIDIVTLGPLTKGCHTYEEALDLGSFAENYKVLVTLLKML